MKIHLGKIQNDKKKAVVRKSFVFFTGFIASLLVAYYLFSNFFYRDRVLPGVQVLGISAAGLNEAELQDLVETTVVPSIPLVINYNIDGYTFSVPTKKLEISIDPSVLLSYGKGSDLFRIYIDGLKLLNSENVTPKYTINIEPVIQELPITKNVKNAAQVKNGQVVNCSNAAYFLSIDNDKLMKMTLNAIDKRADVKGSFQDITENPKDAKIIEYCRKYLEDSAIINVALKKTFGSESDVEQVFGLYVDENSLNWKVVDADQPSNMLKHLKKQDSSPPFDDDYSVWGDKIFLFKPLEMAGGLDVKSSTESIGRWLNALNSDLPLVYRSLDKLDVEKNMQVIDFTQLIASGKTRMSIHENGEKNLKLANAEGAIEELHHTVVHPGEKFSFLDEMGVRPGGMTENWYSFGGGACNASTTLFRAVLGAGFPILERHSHSFYVNSYNWGGYKYNIVQAAVTTDPHLDFVFENDLPYPILLRTNIYQQGEYQYHTIFIMTSGDYKNNRRVELVNWMKWNERSDLRFFGSFEQKVWEGDDLVREETYLSEYVEIQ
ncbi:MAG: VanW family protein [Candidatus Dojkabacteria bacterium]|nr:VanW family protein [Candidatus Dojkabacteria bacterium]